MLKMQSRTGRGGSGVKLVAGVSPSFAGVSRRTRIGLEPGGAA
jgi:hypothetical protein